MLPVAFTVLDTILFPVITLDTGEPSENLGEPSKNPRESGESEEQVHGFEGDRSHFVGRENSREWDVEIVLEGKKGLASNTKSFFPWRMTREYARGPAGCCGGRFCIRTANSSSPSTKRVDRRPRRAASWLPNDLKQAASRTRGEWLGDYK